MGGGVEEGWSGGVDGECEEHQAFAEYVRCEPKHGRSIYPCMLEIDTSCSIGAYNDLELQKKTLSITLPQNI